MAEDEKPKYDLDKIIGELDPDKINEQVEMKHRQARHNYDLKDIKVTDYNKFVDEIASYVKHHENEIKKAELSDEDARGMALSLVRQLYREKEGLKGAMKDAREGRMDKVLDSLANALEHTERNNYVQHVMSKIDPDDFEGHVQLVKQYKSKFEQFMPKEMKSKSAEALAKDYESLIDHHVNVVATTKDRIGEYYAGGEKKKAA